MPFDSEITCGKCGDEITEWEAIKNKGLCNFCMEEKENAEGVA